MRAAVFIDTEQPLSVVERPVPEVAEDELVVKVVYCGICGSDLHAATDNSLGLKPGAVLGHEFSGEVVASGSPDWRDGDRVCAVPLKVCDECRPSGECKRSLGILCSRSKVVGLADGPDGAYAEYVRIDASQAIRLPADITFEQGALIEPFAVALHGIAMAGDLSKASVLVTGAGPIGLAVAIVAKALGAPCVVVSEPESGRQAKAASLGVSGVVDPTQEDLRAAFRAIAGRAPDVILECSGAFGMLQRCVDAAAVRARIVVLAVATRPETLKPSSAMFKEIQLRFALGYERSDFETVLELMRSGRINVSGFVSKIVGLDQLPRVFASLRHGGSDGKVLINPQMKET